MYKYRIAIKSGTDGCFDKNGRDSIVEDIVAPFLPRVGETIEICGAKHKKYLVKDIKYWYIDKNNNGIYVYVIPINIR